MDHSRIARPRALEEPRQPYESGPGHVQKGAARGKRCADDVQLRVVQCNESVICFVFHSPSVRFRNEITLSEKTFQLYFFSRRTPKAGSFGFVLLLACRTGFFNSFPFYFARFSFCSTISCGIYFSYRKKPFVLIPSLREKIFSGRHYVFSISFFFFHSQYERGPSAAAATAYIGARGLLGPGRKSAGRRGVEPAFILQDLMHGRFAGSRGDGVEGELEQRAGEGPVSCDSDDAAPARDNRPHAEPSERQRAHVHLAVVPGASGRWQARNPSGHQPQQRIRRGGIAASAIARGRCRHAVAALLAEGRGPADCQLRAAARRSE